MRAVAVRHTRRHGEQISRAHRLQLPAQLAPAAALESVDENRLIAAFRPAAQMPCGFRKVPGTHRHQAAQQRSFPKGGRDHPRGQHDMMLSGETGAFLNAIVHNGT